MAFALVVTRDQKKVDRVAFDEDPDVVSIGRGSECDVFLEGSLNVSRVHCQVVTRGGVQVVRDLGSSNGTSVNGKRVTEHVLDPGDVITVAEFSLRYESARGPGFAGARMVTEAGGERTLNVARGKSGSLPAATRRGFPRPLAHLELLPPAEARVVVLVRATLVMGTDPSADLVLAPGAPRIAAAIVRDGDAFHLADLSPRRDVVRVDGARAPRAELADAAELEVAGTRLRFRLGPPRVDASLDTKKLRPPPRPA